MLRLGNLAEAHGSLRDNGSPPVPPLLSSTSICKADDAMGQSLARNRQIIDKFCEHTENAAKYAAEVRQKQALCREDMEAIQGAQDRRSKFIEKRQDGGYRGQDSAEDRGDKEAQTAQSNPSVGDGP